MYSLFCSRPEPLISRDLIFGIPARMRADGRETAEVSEAAVIAAIERIRATGADGVVISLLHAWRDHTQEEQVKSICESVAPDLFAFCSSEVWPVIREYERTSTAVLNGYVHPRVSNYLAALEDRLTERKVPARAMLTKSNGGLMNAAEGRRGCVHMLLSGTASGVTGAAWLARQAGLSHVLTLDVGGTSTDFSLIVDTSALSSGDKVCIGSRL